MCEEKLIIYLPTLPNNVRISTPKFRRQFRIYHSKCIIFGDPDQGAVVLVALGF